MSGLYKPGSVQPLGLKFNFESNVYRKVNVEPNDLERFLVPAYVCTRRDDPFIAVVVKQVPWDK